MKEGWKIVKLGKCFSSINNGANIKQIKGAQGFPITRIETLSNDKFNRDRMGYADIYDYSKYSNYILNDGDILMSHINSMKFLGRSVLYNKINNETIIHGMNLLRLVPITNLILCSYVNYYFSTKSFKEQIQGISHQSVNQASFNVTSLKNLDVILPPLEEQHRIVSILDASFEKIDALKKNAEENLKNAKILFQQVLAQELKPKEGWVKKKLGEVATFSQGVQVPLPEQSLIEQEGYSRFLRIIDYTQGNELPRYTLINDSKYKMFKDDIAIVRYGASTGFICMGIEGILANNLFKVNINDYHFIYPYYLSYVLKSEIFQGKIKKQMNGAAMPAISFGMIKNILLPFPTNIEEQHRIVQILDTLSEKCRRLEEVAQQTIRECDALKQSILRQAFSGEL